MANMFVGWGRPTGSVCFALSHHALGPLVCASVSLLLVFLSVLTDETSTRLSPAPRARGDLVRGVQGAYNKL